MRTRAGTTANVAHWLVSVALSLATAAFFIWGIGFTTMLSNSMAPEYPAGSVVMTIQVPTAKLAVGDVIRLPLPGSNGQSYVHRIVDAIPNGVSTTVTTQGDRNATPDPWSLDVVSASAPVVVATIPLLGHLTGITSVIDAQVFLVGLVVVFVVITLRRAFPRSPAHRGPGRHSPRTE